MTEKLFSFSAKLCRALLDYGEAAQVYFGYKAEGITVADFSSVTKDILAKYDKTLTAATVQRCKDRQQTGDQRHGGSHVPV